MRTKNLGIYVMTALLAAVILFLCLQELNTEIPFRFEAVTEAGTQEIRVWKNPGEEYVVFVPGYVDFSQLHLRTVRRRPVWLDGIKLSNGMSCAEIQPDKPYELSYGYGYMTTVTFVKSQNVPAMYIETASGSMDYIHKKKGNAEAGSLQLYTEEGKLDYSGSLLSIKTRGNSTYSSAKKPYSLELSSGGDLLGMGKAQKWILLSNPNDNSHLRNKIVFDFAEAAGMPYSPQCQWVDLYLNGEYAGLYLLAERNEVHPQRVDLPGKDSFLVSVEFNFRPLDHPYFETDRGTRIRIHHSSYDDAALRRIWQSVEDALYAPDGVDPQSGKHWRELLDVDSWARKYLIEEIFANVDGGRASSFFYLDGSGGKICAGPIWDYDYAMSNPITYMELEENVDFRDTSFNMYFVNGTPESLFHPLYLDEGFRSRVAEIYREEFQPKLKQLCGGGVDDYARRTAKAANMNRIRWNEQDPMDQVRQIQSCLEGREAFLTSVWIENREYAEVSARYMSRVVVYAVEHGSSMPELPQFRTYDWCYADTDTPIDPDRPITEDIKIYLKPRAVS